jgi:Glycosyl transferase family 2
MPMDELAFVMAPGQNWFFFELVDSLRYEVEQLGVHTALCTSGFPPRERGRICVLLPPHEYFVLEGGRRAIDEADLKRCLFISAEQPGTVHFEDNVRLSHLSGALFDINAGAVREYRLRGIQAEHLQLGYCARLDRFNDIDDRPVDALFMGCFTPRRGRILAASAPQLAGLRTRLIISDNSRPNSGGGANFLTGEDKFALLARSSTLLNIHQSEEPYFEWTRVVDAIHSGCVVVSEQSTDVGPLVAGQHFLSSRPESLGLMLEAVLGDSELRRRVRSNAYEFLRTQVPLATSAQRLVEAACELDRHSPVRGRGTTGPGRGETTSMIESTIGLGAFGGLNGEETEPTYIVPGTPYGTDPETTGIRRVLKEVRLDLMDLRRVATRAVLTTVEKRPIPPVRVTFAAPAHSQRQRPRTTIVTALYNHGEEIVEALDSLLRSDDTDFEVLVVDDGSTDGSGAVVHKWGADHPEIALLLLSHPINRGLPAARNTALDFARGEYCFVLDADNAVYPNCLNDLRVALDGDPSASFAYGVLSSHKNGQAFGLVSYFPWEPMRLRRGNYIDAMALFRTNELRVMNGYSTDRRLYGWEDYDLFCRFAETARRGVFVDRIVASYRVSDTSMLSLSNVSMTSAFVALKEHCPKLMAAIIPPP